MGLSSDLISQFAKVINKDEKKKSESTVYGTTVEYNGATYVKLDGSDLLTPISTTADTKPGERVTVMIKNHTATVTGNMTSPAARKGDVEEIGNKISEVEILVADKVSTKQLEAEKGRIDNLVTENLKVKEHLEASDAEIDTLQSNYVVVNEKLTAHDASIENLDATKIDAEIVEAKYATIESLEATDAKFNNLDSTYATIKSLEAEKARIDDLDAKKLSAEQADLKYANIDFTNIGKAAIENFYATSGIIKDLVIGDTSVTGKLVGVTITGDLIEGNTVKADKLVILGDDGLYYKLNVNALGETTASSDPKYKYGLDGSVIIAKSITAEKVNVHDLVAFDATIGGFNISDDSIYSGAKASVGNTTTGIYMDKTGQIAFGDGTNFIRYYKGSDGQYKLEISADSISIKSGGESTSLDDAITDLKDEISAAETNINQNKEQIELRATKTEVTTAVNNVTQGIQNDTNEALKNYVPKEDYEEYKKTTTAEFDVVSDKIEANFTITTESISSVENKTQNKFDEISKYIRFSSNGIEIGSTDSPLKLSIDNKNIVFSKNGEQIGYWDGTNFYTGNIVVNVEQRAQFGNFAFVPRSDKSLMFLKVKD